MAAPLKHAWVNACGASGMAAIVGVEQKLLTTLPDELVVSGVAECDRPALPVPTRGSDKHQDQASCQHV